MKKFTKKDRPKMKKFKKERNDFYEMWKLRK